RTNVLGTQNLMDCCRQAWQLPQGGFRQGKRFLQVSTDEVYGSLERDIPEGRTFEIPSQLREAAGGRQQSTAYGSDFFTEESPLKPRSPYSASKASADMLVLAYVHTYGFPALITRCSNNYGPYQFPEKLIPLIINNVLQGQRLPVYGDGRNVRDWLYVDDHCAAIDTVLLNGQTGEVYNIGGFNEKQNIDIVEMIIDQVAELCRNDRKYRNLLADPQKMPDRSLISFVKDRPGHDARYAIDPVKTASQLGWAPRTPFEKGLPLTVKWYLDNRKWVTDIVEGDYQMYYRKMYSER
ncbi:MAG: GDP-mannose 4,6-dehydratase, partial [Muribaculaceae bacterium]|nr:GDP-mannose 4,6-dehydratase [Muribaculaceae bacterium]